jgi:porin
MTAGVVLLPTDWLTISTFVNDNDPEGAATRTGFNTAFHGPAWWTVSQEYEFKWKPFDQPGHQRFGWFWTSRDFPEIGGDSRIQFQRTIRRRLVPRRLLPRWARLLRFGNQVYSLTDFETSADTWGLYYNFDQYLYHEPEDPKQGVGVFGRFGFGSEPNFFEQFYSLGISGKGTIPARDRDTWGIGYYLANLNDDINPAFGLHSEQGFELFYNIEVTPWLHVTPDVQVIINPAGGFQDRDVAVVYGLRAQMSF